MRTTVTEGMTEPQDWFSVGKSLTSWAGFPREAGNLKYPIVH